LGNGLEVGYWRPDGRLDGLVTGYHRYSIAADAVLPHRDVFFPSWAVLRIQPRGADWTVTIGTTSHPVVERAVIFGPTSKAVYSTSGAGMTIGVGLSPSGWRRFAAIAADEAADRLIPAERALPNIARLVAALDDLDAWDGEAIVRLFDAFLLERLGTPHPDEARIAAIHRELATVPEGGIEEMAERLGMSVRTLHRLTRSAFGFGPKLLLRRARFLRSLMLLIAADERRGSVEIEPSYYDYPHFLRDSRLFLGMAPGRFRRLPKPLMEASIRLRAAVLGAPAQALFDPAAPASVSPAPRRYAWVASTSEPITARNKAAPASKRNTGAA